MRLLRLPLQPFLAVSSILIAALAQYLHVVRAADDSALIFFAVAIVFWVATLVAGNVSIEPPAIATPPEIKTRPVSKALVVSTLGLALMAFVFVSDNAFNSDGVLAWLGSIVVFLYAFWNPEKNLVEWRASLAARFASWWEIFANGLRVPMRGVLLIGVALLAFFFYFHNLDRVPAEMTSDHAENILDITDVLAGARPIYFEHNAGREPLDFYATAAFVALTNHPLDFGALKWVSAAFGVLLVLATFLLARELFGFDLALVAAALVAVGKWPVALARQGLAYPLAPLLLALTVYFLVRALKYQRRNDFLLTGFWLGWGLYGFDAFRIVPVFVAAILFGAYLFGDIRRRVALGSYVRNSILVFALALVVALPLVRYALDRPTTFWYQTLTRLGGGEPPLTGNPAILLAENLGGAALMLNWTGDLAWPSNVPGDPALDYVTGGLFVLGVAYALYRTLRFREKVYAFVLLGWIGMLLPSALSLAVPGENPSLVEAGGAIPFVFMLAALPVVWTVRAIAQSDGRVFRGRVAAAGLLALLLAVAARANFNRYFVDYAQTYRQSAWNSSEIATAIRGFAQSIGDAEHAWMMVYPYWVDARNVGTNLGQTGWAQTLANADAARTLPNDPANRLFVLSAQDRDNLARLETLFANGQPRLFHARTPGHDFVLFYVPGTSAPGDLNSQ